MSKYGSFLYGSASYGLAPKLSYSVDPMGIVVLDFSSVYIYWASPTGTFSKVRLVRNQIGFPETEEDGIVIWEETSSSGNVSRSSFIDGVDNPSSVPLIAGRPVYYSVFLFTGSNVWTKAGDVSDLIPSDHGLQKKFIDLIPRVFTSDVYSPLGVPDEASPLYNFIDGLSFSFEQFLTELDLIRPKYTIDIASHKLLTSQFFSFGLDMEPSTSTRSQKILARESRYMYAHKGVKDGLSTYVEALTNYAPTVTVSPNLLLSVQDSTFYQAIGNWQVSNCTLTSSKDQVPVTTSYVTDTLYTGKVVAAGAASITLGADDPIRKGIPVEGDTAYTFSYKVKSPSSAGTTILRVIWYDRTGASLSSDFVSAPTSANNTWQTLWESTTSPSNAEYASFQITFSASGTYYVDQVYAEENYNPVNTSYQEARAIEVYLAPNKSNFIKNPSFEVNTTDSWTLSGSATAAIDTDVSTAVYAGTHSAKITGTGSWTFTSNRIPISQGNFYTGSAYVKSSSNLTMQFIARNSLGTIVESSEIYNLGTVATWTQFQMTDLIDAAEATASTYEIVFSGSTGTFFIDSVQFEKGAKATGYFDGSLPSDFGTVWESAAHNSYSHLYVNKDFKIPHLATTIEGWIPPNAFWNLRTISGVRYTNTVV